MEIVPFTEQDIQLILLACDHSKIYRRNGQFEPGRHTLANHLRNRAYSPLAEEIHEPRANFCQRIVCGNDGQLRGAFDGWLSSDTGGASPRGNLNEMAQASTKNMTDPHRVPGNPAH